MSWLSALSGLGTVISFFGDVWTSLTGWIHDGGIKAAQQAKDEATNAEQGLSEIDRAQGARDDTLEHAATHPGSVREPDPDAAPYDSNGVG